MVNKISISRNTGGRVGSMKVKDLRNYIEENLADGCLNEDDEVYVNDAGMRYEVVALFNHAHELIISETEYIQ